MRASGPSSPLRVLIIEDNPGDARLAQEALRAGPLAARVEHCDRLACAEERFAGGSYDVVLLDLGLPESEGADTIERVRGFAPESPIIVLTGADEERALPEALEADADDFLPKAELDAVSLARAIRHASKRRSLTLALGEQRRRLERSEARLRTVLSTVSDGIAVLDGEGRVLWANAAAARTLGRAAEDVEGVVVPALGGPERGLIELELDESDPAGTREVEIESVPIEWGGTPARVATLHDVTERRRLDARTQAIQRMESLAQLAGGMAHEINNLLALVLANVGLILESPLDGETRELVAEIGRGARRGSALVKRLLAFGRRRRLHVGLVDLGDAVRELAGPLRRLLPANVELDVQSERGCFIQADPDAIEQILLSLVVNARDAMPGGGRIEIEVGRTDVGGAYRRTHPGLREGEHVRLLVSDDGEGMDELARERAFEPFFTTKSDRSGTGLGLPTVYGLTKQQRGFVYLDSELGEGTVVELFFPPAADASTRAPEASSPAAVEVRGGDETILLVEDEEPLRRAGARVLRRFGYEVLEAEDGSRALEVLERRAGAVDLVLSDVIMPNLGGRGLYEALRARTDAPPILFVSGYSAEDLREGEQLDPSFPLLAKPWSVQELLQAVREALTRGVQGQPAD